jgi:TPP-dependent pyruvate/acetoin dehydrogenase alpha subunit
VKEWQTRDPIPRFAARLVEAGILTAEAEEAIKAAAYQTIDDAVEFSENSPEPDLDTILEGVYA